MKLIIGDKNLSSWSLRPWLAMRNFGVPFEEIKIFLDLPNTNSEIKKYSPTGKVPALVDGDLLVWDSLAILEYLNDKYPEKQMWPKDLKTRATARAISSEMHSSFATLRTLLPHKIKERYPGFDSSKAQGDIDRIESLWVEMRAKHKSQGPYLFGEFSLADCMYAPVVNRFRAYDVKVKASTQEYMNTMLAHPGMKEWERDALAE